MVRSSLCHYLDENFTQYKEKITKLSQSDAGVSLVVDEREAYNFDKITEKLYEMNYQRSLHQRMQWR